MNNTNDTSKIYYTTSGSVRGECLHRHRSVRTAAICQDHDYKACRPGGYTDRVILAIDIDGSRRRLNDDEQRSLFEAEDDISGIE